MHLNRQTAALHSPPGTDDPLAERDRQQTLHADSHSPATTTQPHEQQQQHYYYEEKEHSSTREALPAVIWHDRQKRPQIKGAVPSSSSPVHSPDPASSTPPFAPATVPSVAASSSSSTPILASSASSSSSAPLSPVRSGAGMMSGAELGTPLLSHSPAAVPVPVSSRSGEVVIGIGGEGSATPGTSSTSASRPPRGRRASSTVDATSTASVAAADTLTAPATRRASSSRNGRPSRSSRRRTKHDSNDSSEPSDANTEWLRALKQKERSLRTDDDSKQRDEQRQEDDEADEEDEEDEEGRQSDDTSSSSASDSSSSGDEDGEEREEAGGAGAAAVKTLPPTRRSSAADDALRITIIGELVSRQSKLRPIAPSPPLLIPTQQSNTQPAAAEQQQQLSRSTPASTGRSLAPITSTQPVVQPVSTSTPASVGTSTPPSAPAATATISPPFPAPAIVRSTPLLSSVSASASAASTPPVSSLPSPARMLNRIASGELVGSCRVFHSVEALVRSRYDSNYDRPDQPVWISVENADNATVELIGRHFDLHPLTVEDVQSKHTREKLEIFQHYLFLVFHSLQHTDSTGRERRLRRAARKKRRRRRRKQQRRSAQSEAGAMSESADEEQDEGEWSDDDDRELHTEAESESMRTVGIKLIVFPHLVLSFTNGLRFPTLLTVRHRLRRVYDNRLESTAWIIHAMLDSIVDALLPVVDGTVVEVDALEDLIYMLSGSEHRDLLKRMGLTRRRLSFLRQRLWSKRDILMSLIGKDWQLFLAGVQIPYLRDVYDHVVTMLVRAARSTRRQHTPHSLPLPSLTELCRCPCSRVAAVCSTRLRLLVSCWPVCRTRTSPTCRSMWPSSPSSPTR